MKRTFLVTLILLLAVAAIATAPVMSKDSDTVCLKGKYVIGHAIQRGPILVVYTGAIQQCQCQRNCGCTDGACNANERCCVACVCGTPECKGNCKCCDDCKCCIRVKQCPCQQKKPVCKCQGAMKLILVGNTILDPWTLNLRKYNYVAAEYKVIKGQRIVTRVTLLDHSCSICK
jgi:hypothetical protein